MASFTGGPHQRLSRAVAKTLGYRLFMLCITVAVAFLVVDDVGAAMSIGVATVGLKTGTYSLYERARGTTSTGASEPSDDTPDLIPRWRTVRV